MNQVLRQIVNALIEQTEKGHKRWTEVDTDVYRTAVGVGLVRVERDSRRVETEPDFFQSLPSVTVTVTGDGAKVIEDSEFVEGDSSFSVADTFFKTARRSALQSNLILKEMLGSLANAG